MVMRKTLNRKPKPKMSEDKASAEPGLLEFPCCFPIKAMGRNSEEFEILVTGIVLGHAELFDGQPVTVNQSGGGNFLSVTVTIVGGSGVGKKKSKV